MERSISARATLITIAHGLVGWAFCGARIGIGTAATTIGNALVIHAAAAPLIFAVVSLACFRRFGAWLPLTTAVTFLTVVTFGGFQNLRVPESYGGHAAKVSKPNQGDLTGPTHWQDDCS